MACTRSRHGASPVLRARWRTADRSPLARSIDGGDRSASPHDAVDCERHRAAGEDDAGRWRRVPGCAPPSSTGGRPGRRPRTAGMRGHRSGDAPARTRRRCSTPRSRRPTPTTTLRARLAGAARGGERRTRRAFSRRRRDGSACCAARWSSTRCSSAITRSITGATADLVCTYLPGLDLVQHGLFGAETVRRLAAAAAERLEALEQYYVVLDALLAPVLQASRGDDRADRPHRTRAACSTVRRGCSPASGDAVNTRLKDGAARPPT